MKRLMLSVLCAVCLCGCMTQQRPHTDPAGPVTRPGPAVEIPLPPQTVESSVAPTEPSTAPTEPSTAPTEPSTAPTEPSTAPTEPSTAPSESPDVTEPAFTEPERAMYYDNSRMGLRVAVTEQAVIVASVTKKGAADLAGITAGDILTRLDGRDITDNDSLCTALANCRSAEKVKVEIVRREQTMTVYVTLDAGIDKADILPEYVSWYQKNADVIGWIRIPGIKTDDPVMQTPGNKDYYLTHNIDGNYSKYGELYVREKCDVFAPSDNLVIYGHHMKDDTMFGQLDKYKTKSFWKDHQYIYFDTLYEKHTYQIIAVFKTSGTTGVGFAYYKFNDAASAAEFDAFIATCKDLSFYDTGLSAQYGDKLITLSTCEYTLDNGRFVVVAKRIS